MKVGRRLAMKVLNASRLVLGYPDPGPDATVTEPADLAMLAELRTVVGTATRHFDAFDYTSALEVTERFFWQFCDDYLELVKERAYGSAGQDGADSARLALTQALNVLLRLLAPILPFVTEEVWSWWQSGSIHTSAWPTAEDLGSVDGDPRVLADVAAALIAIRGAKSNAKVSMKTEISHAKFSAPEETLRRIQAVEADLRAVGRITGDIAWQDSPGELRVDVTLATTEQ
jgi:valyl-tRNA synthetase